MLAKIVILAAPVLGILLTLFLQGNLDKFRKRIRYIETARDLKDLKEVVSVAMYGGIVQFSLLFVPLVAYLAGLANGDLGLNDLLLVVIPSGVYLLFYARYKKVEDDVRNTRADNQDLLDDFVFVIDTWKKSALPKW